ncbi:hypothetical protein GCM10027046_14040 [Uliginosibacterium flavum]
MTENRICGVPQSRHQLASSDSLSAQASCVWLCRHALKNPDLTPAPAKLPRIKACPYASAVYYRFLRSHNAHHDGP